MILPPAAAWQKAPSVTWIDTVVFPIDARSLERQSAFGRRVTRLTGALVSALAAALGTLECTMGDSGAIYFVSSSAKPKPPIFCRGDGQCPPPMPYCEPAAGICIQCLADPNCGGPKRFCGPHRACVECVADNGCDKAKPFCDVERFSCIECRDNVHCNPGKVCQTASGRCVPSCVDSRECHPMEPYCDAARGFCVQCIADGNCPDAKKPVCAADVGDCVECMANVHCDAAHPVCNPLTYHCEG